VDIYKQGNLFADIEKLLPEARLLVGRKRPDKVFVEFSLYPNGSKLKIPGREDTIFDQRMYYREEDCFYSVFSWLADMLHTRILEIHNDFTMQQMEEFLLKYGMDEKDI